MDKLVILRAHENDTNNNKTITVHFSDAPGNDMIPNHLNSDALYRRLRGFTLIEMLVVVAIIAILAVIAIPSKGYRHIQMQVVETLDLAEPVTTKISEYYALNGSFPVDNEALGLPKPDQYKGNYLSALNIEKGAIQLSLGQKSPEMLQGKTLTLQPVYVKDSPQVPASWICGYDPAPSGMNAAGDNRTDITFKYLPLRCRK